MPAARAERRPGLVTKHTPAKPAWGHRKIWTPTRHDGHKVSQATALRLLCDGGRILPSEYQKQRRELAKDRKATFAKNPTVPNRVWQFDFNEFETTQREIWLVAGCRDWYSKIEQQFHVSRTANQYDASAATELALADYEATFGHPLVAKCQIDEETGEVLLTIVTDSGGPFRSLNFELFIIRHPELRHVRTRVRTPVQIGSHECGIGTLKYERLFLDDIPDAFMLVERRGLPNRVQHRAPSRGDLLEPATGGAPGAGQPTIPTFEAEEILPTA